MHVPDLKCLVALTLAAVSVSLVNAEPHCPGNVISLPLRLVERSQLVTTVSINHQGPFDFLVDTGAQVTTVDPQLAAELDLKTQGTAGVTGVQVHTRAPLVLLELVEAGSHAVPNILAVIQNLGELQSADRRVRGVLAGNFLEHFDLLVDYARQVLCLDDSMQMRTRVKGQRIALADQLHSHPGSAVAQRLVVPVALAGLQRRQVLLQLDSGSNAPLLYDPGEDLRHLQAPGSNLQSRGTDGKEHAFRVLAAQDIRVGPHIVRQVSFVSPVTAAATTASADVDGLLPAALFQRVFVNYSDHYVVLEPW